MFDKIIHTMKGYNISYEVLELNDNWKIIVSSHGGHIYGPFSEGCPEGIFWMTDEVGDPEAFGNMIASKTWNTGGDRVWIAPEIQFNIRERARFRETLKTPATIDPGNFKLDRKQDVVSLCQAIVLESRNTVSGMIDIRFRQQILKAPNPLRKAGDHMELMDGMEYCGFEQIIDLSCSGDPGIFAEGWDLLQIRPKGRLYIPMYRVSQGTDHYEAVGDMETIGDNGIFLSITGTQRYKVAYKSVYVTGRFGYLADSDTEDSYLIIKNFPNNPSCMYSEEPPLQTGDRGYSIHIYNDDGNSGGFAEMECNLYTIGQPTGLSHASCRVSTWIFVGNRKKLGGIAELLLGCNMETVIISNQF
ncbi:MAG: hypothetical protein ACRDBO_18185 [Lachnospiraceae bacterium]